MSDIQVVKGEGQLTIPGLAAGIGLCALDATAEVGGMVHIVLPISPTDRTPGRVGMYANTALPALLDMMEQAGAQRDRVRAAFAGGAQPVTGDKAESAQSLQIGVRNIEAVLKALTDLGIPLTDQDTGGHLARRLVFSVDNGVVTVQMANGPERLLSNLGGKL
ncbi:MAG: chemotaxis protein CheD [Fimbriimonas ginsengisoli]|uniref:Probable chemoreceptor glutamine deamidase CheD n=1 Tax=Fimbriimonas ginsengisoli TaxID=1005039 RepID=A0A931PUN6_FIMGI|nr:chemotaxis protein CheD [Fimbriimonas ginsengisoli]MBI3721806.1 chemotaxis protein CheD [Fimbriimonas ginsengisoli]